MPSAMCSNILLACSEMKTHKLACLYVSVSVSVSVSLCSDARVYPEGVDVLF